MIAALDQVQGKAVLGTNVGNEREMELRKSAESNRYRCLLCDSKLTYVNQGGLFGYFLHDNQESECVKDGNVSSTHRLAQEVVCAKIFNALPDTYCPIQIDIESRVGDQSDFLVTDVRLSAPFRIAVEIVYKSSHVSLRRRLQTLYSNDYRAMLVFVLNGRISVKRAQHHIRKLSPVQIGRFDPDSLRLELGSIVDSSQIDPQDSPWQLVPDYLS